MTRHVLALLLFFSSMNTKFYVGAMVHGRWMPWGEPPMVWLDFDECVAAAEEVAEIFAANGYAWIPVGVLTDITGEYELVVNA